MNSIVALLDADGTIVHVNQAWRAFAQRERLGAPDDGIGSNYFDVALCGSGPGSSDAVHITSALRELSEGLRDSFECEYLYQKTGQHRWFSMRASRLSTRSPRVFVQFTDITVTKLARMESEQRFQRLTQRESEILHRIASGKSSKQIAADFNISVRTVENHRHHILTKARAENVADLVRLAAHAGLLAHTDHAPPTRDPGPPNLIKDQPARLATAAEPDPQAGNPHECNQDTARPSASYLATPIQSRRTDTF